MKKKLVSALALMMSCVMLARCGGNKVEENTAIPQTETSEAVTESTEEAKQVQKLKQTGELTDVNVAALKGPTAMGMVKLMDDSDNGDTGANHYNFTIAKHHRMRSHRRLCREMWTLQSSSGKPCICFVQQRGCGCQRFGSQYVRCIIYCEKWRQCTECC